MDSGDDETAAANNAASLLTSHKDIDYILATTVIASSGGQQAVAEAGLSGKTKIVAFDIDTVTLDAIGAGTVEATISQAPCAGVLEYGIFVSYQCGDDYLSGKLAGKRISFPAGYGRQRYCDRNKRKL